MSGTPVSAPFREETLDRPLQIYDQVLARLQRLPSAKPSPVHVSAGQTPICAHQAILAPDTGLFIDTPAVNKTRIPYPAHCSSQALLSSKLKSQAKADEPAIDFGTLGPARRRPAPDQGSNVEIKQILNQFIKQWFELLAITLCSCKLDILQ